MKTKNEPTGATVLRETRNYRVTLRAWERGNPRYVIRAKDKNVTPAQRVTSQKEWDWCRNMSDAEFDAAARLGFGVGAFLKPQKTSDTATRTKRLSYKTLHACFIEATAGTLVGMTHIEVWALLDRITARTKAEAVREIRADLDLEP